jgi:hypothetical protein
MTIQPIISDLTQMEVVEICIAPAIWDLTQMEVVEIYITPVILDLTQNLTDSSLSSLRLLAEAATVAAVPAAAIEDVYVYEYWTEHEELAVVFTD